MQAVAVPKSDNTPKFEVKRNQNKVLLDAFHELQDILDGEFERLGSPSEEEIVQMVKEIRKDLAREKQLKNSI